MKRLSIAAKLWLPTIVMGIVMIVMSAVSAVRTSHLQTAAKQMQEAQQSKLELSVRWAGLTEANAARVVASLTSADPALAGNLKSDQDPHMHNMTLEILSDDHIKATWTFYKDGKPEGDAMFDFKRKKK